jgi:hypothetical protein
VFRLVKLLVSLVCLGVFVWWGLTVQLGRHTLFGHIAAIGASKESKELVRGTREKVADLKKKIVEESASPSPSAPSRGLNVTDDSAEGARPAPAKPASGPEERLTRADRRDIKRLLDAKRGKSATGATN